MMHAATIIRMCFLGLIAAALPAAMPATPAGAGEIRFKHHVVDADLPGGSWGYLLAVDLDGDGRPDLVTGQAKSGNAAETVYWYRNTGRPDVWSPRALLGQDSRTDCGMAALDLDRDGAVDLVTSGAWFRNPGKPKPGDRFERREIAAAGRAPLAGAHDVLSADLDGNGRPVIIAFADKRKFDGLWLLRPGSDLRKPWAVQRVIDGSGVHGALAPAAVGDLNGDGRPDLVLVNQWLENPGKPDAPWPVHANLDFGRVGPWGLAARAVVADVDRDGHMDIVQSECDSPNARIAWFRNSKGDGSAWERHLLPETGTGPDFHSLVVADLDADGDLDVYADEMESIHLPPDRKGKAAMHLWENLDGKGGQWKRHTLAAAYGGHSALVADLDGDGDLDIATKTWTPNADNSNGGRGYLSVLENLLKDTLRPPAPARAAPVDVAQPPPAGQSNNSTPPRAAVPQTPPAPTIALPWAADFKAGVAAWTSIAGTWNADAGEYAGRADGKADAAALAGDPAWTDYALQARMKIVAPGGRAKMTARYTDERNYIVCEIQADRKWFGIWEIRGGKAACIGRVDEAIEPGTWHTLRLELKGPAAKGFLDGQERVSGKVEHAAGRIGLRAAGEARFADVAAEK